MKVTDREREIIASRAKLEGYDPDMAIEALEAIDDMDRTKSDEEEETEKPAQTSVLIESHYPFIFVRELRASIGLSEPFPGDDQIASDWASKHPNK